MDSEYLIILKKLKASLPNVEFKIENSSKPILLINGSKQGLFLSLHDEMMKSIDDIQKKSSEMQVSDIITEYISDKIKMTFEKDLSENEAILKSTKEKIEKLNKMLGK